MVLISLQIRVWYDRDGMLPPWTPESFAFKMFSYSNANTPEYL